MYFKAYHYICPILDNLQSVGTSKASKASSPPKAAHPKQKSMINHSYRIMTQSIQINWDNFFFSHMQNKHYKKHYKILLLLQCHLTWYLILKTRLKRTIYFDIEISEHNYRDYYISTLLGCVIMGLLCSSDLNSSHLVSTSILPSLILISGV